MQKTIIEDLHLNHSYELHKQWLDCHFIFFKQSRKSGLKENPAVNVLLGYIGNNLEYLSTGRLSLDVPSELLLYVLVSSF